MLDTIGATQDLLGTAEMEPLLPGVTHRPAALACLEFEERLILLLFVGHRVDLKQLSCTLG